MPIIGDLCYLPLLCYYIEVEECAKKTSIFCLAGHINVCVCMYRYAFVYSIVIMVQCSLFPLLQSYDEHLGLSIIGYYGVVRTIRLYQKKFPVTFSGSHDKIEQATKANSEWVRRKLTAQLVIIM